MSDTIIGMSDITYTRITPNGEEKCSLLGGDGMTIEEKRKKLRKYCNDKRRSEGCSTACPLYEFNCYAMQDMQTNFLSKIHLAQIDEAYAIITAPNFIKANPDDEVEGEVDAVESDAVNHPDHYTQNGIECIAAIKASMTADGFMDYCKGNILKYIWRWRDKGGAEDLHKARVYLDWLIEEAEK